MKRKVLKTGLIVTALAGGLVLITPGLSSGELSLPFIESQISNHEQRITTLENQAGVTPSPMPTDTASAPVGVAPTLPGDSLPANADPRPTTAPNVASDATPAPEPAPASTPSVTGTSGLNNSTQVAP